MKKEEEKVLAWHFTSNTLRDGRPIPPIGEVLHVPPPIRICERGCHASRNIIDALYYAPGTNLHRVELWGSIREQKDKLVASNRRILWSINSQELLREAARKFALRVIHLWEPKQVVVNYLKTGNPDLRASAWASAEAGARASAEVSAVGSAWASAWASARASAEVSAEGSAWDSAWASAYEEMENILLDLVARYRPADSEAMVEYDYGDGRCYHDGTKL